MREGRGRRRPRGRVDAGQRRDGWTSCGEANAGAGGNVRAREMKVTMTRTLDGLGDAAEEIARGGGAGGETLARGFVVVVVGGDGGEGIRIAEET